MKKLVFCHGLPYKSTFFSAMAQSFQLEDKEIKIFNLDLGYYSEPNMYSNEDFNGAIAIGHGIGFNKLLDMDVNWKGIVGISTTLKFLSDDLAERKIKNLENAFLYNKELAIKSMVSRLTNNEIFFGLPYVTTQWDTIESDISYLKNTDSTKILKKKDIPSLFLLGGSDVWYDEVSVIKQLKKYDLQIKENASHMLGYLDINWCKNRIIKFMNSL